MVDYVVIQMRKHPRFYKSVFVLMFALVFVLVFALVIVEEREEEGVNSALGDSSALLAASSHC